MINIASVQMNFTVGDIDGNIAKITQSYNKAKELKADLVVFSEMAVTGYPAEDLVLLPQFQIQAAQAIDILSKVTIDGPAIIVGSISKENNHLYNSAFFIENGIVHTACHKHNLPNYGIFDEKRIFYPGHPCSVISFRGIKLGIIICEDIWTNDLAMYLKDNGAKILISINASPYDKEKQQMRYAVAKNCVKATNLPIIYVNQIGGQDEVVFDGGSFALDNNTSLIKQQPYWLENISITKWNIGSDYLIPLDPRSDLKLYEYEAQEFHIYEAMKLALKDYVNKNNFSNVIIGMSGGIDSALTAAIAVDSLGSEKVKLFMLPYIYTSTDSIEDAKLCAKWLNVELEVLDIAAIVNSAYSSLANLFKDQPKDITEENIQSRARGLILMALSNKFGGLLLTTGNKSEMAVGYATLYGDMCGGYNLIKDLYKTQVYQMANWRNQQSQVIPENIINKPASAELKENQTDQDFLPEYEILDNILYLMIEKKYSSIDIARKLGFELSLVEKIAKLLKQSEYKRYQSPLGVKISSLAFGRDRRFPITNGFKF